MKRYLLITLIVMSAFIGTGYALAAGNGCCVNPHAHASVEGAVKKVNAHVKETAVLMVAANVRKVLAKTVAAKATNQ